MKTFMLFLTIACLCVTCAYGLTTDEKNRLADVHNLTRDVYILVAGVLNDLSNSKLSGSEAQEKLSDWQSKYNDKISPVPPEAEKMCGLMNKVFDTAQDAARDYRVHDQSTKDKLKAVDSAQGELSSAMKETSLDAQ